MFFPYRFLNLLHRIFFVFFVAPFFKSCGANSIVLRPRAIQGINRIFIGRDVYVSDGCLLAAVPHTGSEECALRIGDGCSIGRNNHLYAISSVVFEPEVLTANNVYVSDNSHSYNDTSRAILKQPVLQLQQVRIGRGSWLGQNVCVIGASIGRGCVIGANSVVLSDIPDYCVAVGSPARVIRQLDPGLGRWVKSSDEREP